MVIDTLTLLVAAGAVVAISGVSFILNTVLRRNDTYGRIWSIAFVAGILETLSYLVWATSDAAWWASAVGNASLVLSISFMWSGARSYNERLRTYVWVSLIGSALVLIATLVEGPGGGDWAGAEVMFIAIVIFASLAGWETVRGALKRSVNGRVLTIVFWIVALYYLLRTLVFITAGESSVAFTQYFGTVTTTFIAIVLVIVAAISMSVLQPADSTRTTESGRRTGTLVIPGVVSAEQFEQLSGDWLARSKRDRESLVFFELSIDNIEQINTAFGREMGDEAITAVGRTACEVSPAAALVGYLGRERFVVLTTPPAFGSAVDIAERLQTALVETPIDVEQGIRATVVFGLATTDDVGHSLDALEKVARAEMRASQGETAGTASVASSNRNTAETTSGPS
jgi:diguanylate cyclase (GGDEF)-like protein